VTVLSQLAWLGVVAAATCVGVRLVDRAERWVVAHGAFDGTSGAGRSLHTRARLGRNLGAVLVVCVGLVAAVASFEGARTIGASLAASAGIATLVLGFAAQRVLGAILAGVAIAATEPVRIDDVVVVEGEGGWVDEITLTHVVVRLWDQRRLVVPIAWFLEQPFQNWTRHDAGLVAALELKLDPRIPVAGVRAELDAILERCAEWDGRVRKLQVCDLDRGQMTLRIQAGARHPDGMSDLCGTIREELLRFLQQEHPDAFFASAEPSWS
jgi:small-conductance mechanosensitive channel